MGNLLKPPCEQVAECAEIRGSTGRFRQATSTKVGSCDKRNSAVGRTRTRTATPDLIAIQRRANATSTRSVAQPVRRLGWQQRGWKKTGLKRRLRVPRSGA